MCCQELPKASNSADHWVERTGQRAVQNDQQCLPERPLSDADNCWTELLSMIVTAQLRKYGRTAKLSREINDQSAEHDDQFTDKYPAERMNKGHMQNEGMRITCMNE